MTQTCNRTQCNEIVECVLESGKSLLMQSASSCTALKDQVYTNRNNK